MKQAKDNRIVKRNTKGTQWKAQQAFGRLAAELNRLPDADEVMKNPLRSAPLGLVEMVF